MKKRRKYQPADPHIGELILAVSAVSRNNREAIAAVADLIESGKIKTWERPKKKRP